MQSASVKFDCGVFRSRRPEGINEVSRKAIFGTAHFATTAYGRASAVGSAKSNPTSINRNRRPCFSGLRLLPHALSGYVLDKRGGAGFAKDKRSRL